MFTDCQFFISQTGRKKNDSRFLILRNRPTSNAVATKISPYVRGGMKCVRCAAVMPSSADEMEWSTFLPSDADGDGFPNMSDDGGGGGGSGSRAEEVGVLFREEER